MRQQSVLPKNLEKHNFVGELSKRSGWVWVNPWSLLVDQDGLLWISSQTQYFYSDGGTSSMKIKRDGNFILVKEESIFSERYSKSSFDTEKYLPVVLV